MSVPYLPQEIPLKRAATINDEALGESTEDDFELNYIDIGNVDSNGQIHEITTYKFGQAPSRARRIVRHGDVIISTVRTYLQAIAPIENPPSNLIVSTGFAVVRPRPGILDTNFCKYALREPRFIHEVINRSVGVSYPAINASELGDIPICLPPFITQRAIAAYLDRETARIDALIDAKQRLLALLAEKRRALITHAVTRGLDPDAPMRDSGVSWIGKIPAHWEVTNLKYLAQIGNGSTPKRDYMPYWQDGNFPWLTSTVVNQDVVEEPIDFVTEFALRECHLPIVEPNSVLIAITGEGKTRGKAAILPYRSTINQHMAYISAQPHLLHYEFLQRYLAGSYEILRMISEGTGSTKGALTSEQIGDFPIAIPSVSEQMAILNGLKKIVQYLDDLDIINQQAMDLLEERRASLISAAVTGNIETVE